MTSESTSQLAAALLLASFIGLMAIGLMATVLVFLYVRRTRGTEASSSNRPKPPAPAQFRPSIFDQACCWMVVKSAHLSAVQSALGLHNPVQCSWDEGLATLTQHRLFVAPPVRGWILVVGQGLPDPADDPDACFHFLLKLSRSLGQIQLFCVNRAVNHYGWVRAESGKIRRGYAWAGQTVWNQGQPTRAELDLGIKCYAYGEQPSALEVSAGASPTGNADKVMALAARWSFDPTSIDTTQPCESLGIVGELIQSKTH